MTDNSTDQSSERRVDRSEPALTPAPPTMVGLGRPEPPLAATSAYADEVGTDPIQKQTLVGFLGPPLDFDDADQKLPVDELADASDDEVTVVGGYDEVTVVTPSDALGLAQLLHTAEPGSPDDAWPEEAPTEASPILEPGSGPDTSPDTTQAESASTTRQAEAPSEQQAESVSAEPDADRAPDAAAATSAPLVATLTRSLPPPPPPPRPSQVVPRHESRPPPSSDRDLFISRDTELQLFAPPVEMFGPGAALRSRFESMPPPRPTEAHLQSDAPWYTQVEPESAPARSASSRTWLLALLAASLGALGLLSAGLFLPTTGRVLVTAAGPLDAPVPNAAVLVDGKQVCAPAPCRVTLQKGAYALSVVAPAYRRAAEKSVMVSRGEEEAIHFTLKPDDSAGVEVKSEVAGLRVLVDGLERGTTPLTVRGLSPGKHNLQVAAGSRYVPLDTELELEADRIAVFEPKLVHQPEPEPTAAEAERAITPAELAASPKAAPKVAAPSASSTLIAKLRAASGVPVAAAKVDLDTPEPEPADATVTLSVTSNPPSNVVVDGRPLGRTPREVAVSPGDHSVVFIHETKGRKSVRVHATGGKSAAASVQF